MNKSVALATESPRFGFAKPPPFGKGGFGAHSKGSLAKGSWHGEAVTEGFYSGHFLKVQTNVKRGRFFRE